MHQIVVIMTIKEFFSFRQNKYFWINILAMIAVVVLLMFGTLKGIDIYTHHGEAVVVPDVKGMTVAEAGAVFDSRGLACIVSDSTYVKDKPAGCILDYNPAAGQKVKEGRIIYLTINAINIPLQVVPDVADNKFNAVKQLVRFIRENDKNPGGFEDLWENSFALEDELDEIILRIAHIIELEKALEEYEE